MSDSGTLKTKEAKQRRPKFWSCMDGCNVLKTIRVGEYLQKVSIYLLMQTQILKTGFGIMSDQSNPRLLLVGQILLLYHDM